jgi:hypothetical protein
MFMNNAPSTIKLPETITQSKFELFSLAFRVDVHAPSCRRGEAHVAASCDLHVVKGKGGFSARENVSHVAMQACSPRDKNGVGTSNISISEWRSARIPSLFSSRTALAYLSISAWMSISSGDEGSCRPRIVMVSSP